MENEHKCVVSRSPTNKDTTIPLAVGPGPCVCESLVTRINVL